MKRLIWLCLLGCLGTWSQARSAPSVHFTANPVQGTICVAPCAVHFDATATTDGAFPREFHSLHYRWNFGDATVGTWAVSGAPKNIAFGAIAGHLYAEPGTYTVTLAVTNPDREAVSTQQFVTVTDPDAHFAAADTFCFANTGTPGAAGFEDCPVPARSRHVVIGSGTANGFNIALGAAHCDVTSTKRRCLFRAGDTFLQGDAVNPRDAVGGPGLIASFGVGANPIISGGNGLLVLETGWTVAHLHATNLRGGHLVTLTLATRNNTVYDVSTPGTSGACVSSNTGGNSPTHSDLVAIVELDCTLAAGSAVTALFLRAERALILGNVIDSAYAGQFNLRTVHFPRSLIQHNRLMRPQEDPGNERNSLQIRGWGGARLPAVTPTERVIISDNILSQDNGNIFIRTCQDSGCGGDTINAEIRDIIIERNFLYFSTGGTSTLR